MEVEVEWSDDEWTKITYQAEKGEQSHTVPTQLISEWLLDLEGEHT